MAPNNAYRAPPGSAAIVRPLLLSSCLVVALLAGCATQDAKAPDGAVGGGRTSHGDSPSGEGPETLYLVRTDGGTRLSPDPDPYPREGGGFAIGSRECSGMTPATGGNYDCWSGVFTGPTESTHAAGEPVHLWFYMQGKPTADSPVVADARLYSHGEPVANGTSQPMSPGPGTVVPGDDGCALAEVDLPLGAAVPAGDELSLVLRVDGIIGSECYGGGKDGSRLLLGAPGSPS